MKRIVAALDLTAHADRAFERAAMLGTAHGAELTVVHVIDDNVLRYEEEGGTLVETLKGKAQSLMAPYTKGSPIAGHISIGKAWEEIIAAELET